MKTLLLSRIEVLEPRVAPAIVFTISGDGHTGTYTDLDGDLVTLKITKGNLSHAPVIFDQTDSAFANGQTLTKLTLTAAEFAGTDIILTATRGAAGDGFANVSTIDATGNDLHKVAIDGDLAVIDCGSGSSLHPALSSLHAQSMGALLPANLARISHLAGSIGSIAIKHDLYHVQLLVFNGMGLANIGSFTTGGSLLDSVVSAQGNLTKAKVAGSIVGGLFGAGVQATVGKLGQLTVGGSVSGGTVSGHDLGKIKVAGDVRAFSNGAAGQIVATGRLDSITVGGDLIGGTGADSGLIRGELGIGSVFVGGDLRGSSGAHSGAIEAGRLDATTDAVVHSGALAKVIVGGSLLGGSAKFSGSILSVENLGTATVGHDVIGGSANNTGDIDSFGDIGRVTVSGRLQGGTNYAGRIVAADGKITAVKVRGDVVGGTGFDSGAVYAGSDLGSVTIGGSVYSGTTAPSGTIRSGEVLGNVTIAGDLVGSATAPVFITGTGPLMAVVGTSPVAIKSLTIGGTARFAEIIAGVQAHFFAPLNGDAGIGKVKIGGDAIGLRISAGTIPKGDTLFGTSDDLFIGGGDPKIVSKIASVTIGGQLLGTPSSVNATDSFCIIAQTIGPVKIGQNAPFTPPDHNTVDLGPTHDVQIRTIG